jgi:hypothetical protein
VSSHGHADALTAGAPRGGLLHRARVTPHVWMRRRRHGLLRLEDSSSSFSSLSWGEAASVARGPPCQGCSPTPLRPASATPRGPRRGPPQVLPPRRAARRRHHSRLFRHSPPRGCDSARRASHLRSPRDPPRVRRATSRGGTVGGGGGEMLRIAPPHLASPRDRLPCVGLFHHTSSSVSSVGARLRRGWRALPLGPLDPRTQGPPRPATPASSALVDGREGVVGARGAPCSGHERKRIGVVYRCCNNILGMLQSFAFMLQLFVNHIALVASVFLTCCEYPMRVFQN